MKRTAPALFLAAACAALAAGAARGAPETPAAPPRGTATVAWEVPDAVRAIRPHDVFADSANVAASAYPDADTVLMDSVTFEAYEPDGTSATYDDTYAKILTEKGRREQATASLHYNAFYGAVDLVAAEVLKPDGSVRPVDLSRNAHVMVDPGMMGANIYDPNDKVLQVSYPGLEVGDIVRLAFRRTTTKARVPGVWSDYQTFEGQSPVRRCSYYVSAPPGRPVRHAVLRGEVPGTVESRAQALDGGRTLHVWDVRDVPQLFPEPDMPPEHTVCQRLLASTAESWQALSRWYWGLCKPRLDSVTDDMKATVASILARSSGQPENRIWNIFTWVSQNIRYMGVTTETEAPGYEPHDVSTTFERRYGVCRDKAALLVSMLRLAGFDAYPVLIHVGERRDPDVPMTFFNHAIVAVRSPDGDYALMDPTNENARDPLPAYLGGKSFLVASPEGEGLRTSPEAPASANMVFVASQGKVDADGTLTLTTTIEFDGLNDSAYRGTFARMPDERRRQFFEELAKSRIAGAALTSLEIRPADLRDTDTPLSATFSLTAADFPATGEAATLVEPPWFSSSVGYVNFLLGSTGLRRRRFPLETEDACGVEETIALELGGVGAPVALPGNVSFRTNGVTFSQAVSCAPARAAGDGEGPAGAARLSCSRRFELNLSSYPPELYPGFKESLHEVERCLGRRAVFGRGPSVAEAKADQRIVSRETAFDVVDSSSWTTTVTTVREILTYAGRKAHSELKIPFNPAWEEVELLDASVSNANGRVQTARPEEINVMDAGWAASAPRYPAAKTMVVSLPGVEVGSTVRTSYRVSRTRAPFFSAFHAFQETDPVEEDRLVLRSRDNTLIRFLACQGEGLVETVATNGDVEVYTLVAKSPGTLPREERLPPAYVYAKSVFLSDGDWRRYADSLGKAVHDAAAPSNSLLCCEKALELCRGLDAPEDRIRAIRDFVARAIRLAGPSFTDLPLAATPADVTLRDGYGNLLDRAVVLSAMLFDAGFDNRIVFADDASPFAISGEDPRYDYPDPGIFTAPLVEVATGQDGGPVFLNDTTQYARLGVTGHDRHIALAPDEPGANGPLVGVEAAEGCRDGALSTRTIELDAMGNATVTVTNFYSGTDAAAMKRRYSEMTPEQFSRHHQELVGGVSVAAEARGALCVDLESYPHVRSYAAYAPDYAPRTGGTLALDLGPPGDVLPLHAETRRLPLLAPRLPDAVDITTVILPPEAAETLVCPTDVTWNYTPIFFGLFSQTVEKGVLPDGRKTVKMVSLRRDRERTILGAEFHKSILDMNRRLGSPNQRTIVIRLSE